MILYILNDYYLLYSIKVVENGAPSELLQIADGYFKTMMESCNGTMQE